MLMAWPHPRPADSEFFGVGTWYRCFLKALQMILMSSQRWEQLHCWKYWLESIICFSKASFNKESFKKYPWFSKCNLNVIYVCVYTHNTLYIFEKFNYVLGILRHLSPKLILSSFLSKQCIRGWVLPCIGTSFFLSSRCIISVIILQYFLFKIAYLCNCFC